MHLSFQAGLQAAYFTQGTKICTQKLYSVLVGAVTNKEESTWSNDAQRGEAGQSAAWLCT
jgi:hypothetical protein